MSTSSQQQEAPLQPSRISPEAQQQKASLTLASEPTKPTNPSSSSSSPSLLNQTATTANRLTTGQVPCAKRSLLTGIAAGVGITAVGAIAGRKMLHASNWGAGAFVFVSLGTWQVCRSARSAETARMKTIIEEHNRKGRGAAGSGQSA
ncbi:hypothetical protein BDZ90DRAFT_279193 [Jaminaea rosea]|uniref:Cytochrome c oxidase assembly protein COX20, mitochondrial n=1 Tax=Jaminaea rosea TaxID=1569628 RepID=A0A316UUQ6_9BASI|nr:hypothetical protein BDZ90DRAFT_279193 [Jaminaea rosea]PWN28061.1 hypothetical protein BDZ90DRAFT_279193 [Jaminaea rosea]